MRGMDSFKLFARVSRKGCDFLGDGVISKRIFKNISGGKG
jgi:hypothetical protein